MVAIAPLNAGAQAYRQTPVDLCFRYGGLRVAHGDNPASPLTHELAWLSPIRQVGVGARPGYPRPQPTAVLHRYPYDRGILRALNDLSAVSLSTCQPPPVTA